MMSVPLKVFPPPEVEVMDWDDLAKYASEVLKGGRRSEKD
jgi:hypothetical protein